jgi:hypothetical protein
MHAFQRRHPPRHLRRVMKSRVEKEYWRSSIGRSAMLVWDIWEFGGVFGREARWGTQCE